MIIVEAQRNDTRERIDMVFSFGQAEAYRHSIMGADF
jgi:hypothetical protein